MTTRARQFVILVLDEGVARVRVRSTAVLALTRLSAPLQVNQSAVLALTRVLPEVIFTEHQTEYKK